MGNVINVFAHSDLQHALLKTPLFVAPTIHSVPISTTPTLMSTRGSGVMNKLQTKIKIECSSINYPFLPQNKFYNNLTFTEAAGQEQTNMNMGRASLQHCSRRLYVARVKHDDKRSPIFAFDDIFERFRQIMNIFAF